jgi:hypothetical protein
VGLGGEAAGGSLVAGWAGWVRLLNLYGTTECTVYQVIFIIIIIILIVIIIIVIMMMMMMMI